MLAGSGQTTALSQLSATMRRFDELETNQPVVNPLLKAWALL
ncbi:hypothetical protein [Nocardia ignorata]|uniref:Uncharacterized protein n=1 Tax=Nocardia ignorata TaxID=145285 RepID=A0A4R6PLR5_NOCIG|nr:hypothetical protein [Nocardia ignorata]TDP37699.1 hypothetical protein DFR75_10449 [Nocardia ignorata]